MKLALVFLSCFMTGCAMLKEMSPSARAERKQQLQEEKLEREKAEDEAYLREFESLKKSHTDINYELKIDGVNFEQRVLEFAKAMDINNLTEAFELFYKLVKRGVAKKALIDGSLKEGTSRQIVRNYWGDPGRTELSDAAIAEWYDDDTEPMIFTYNKKTLRLNSWKMDEASAQRKIDERKEAARENHYRAMETRLRMEMADIQRAQAWQNLGNTMNTVNQQNQIDQLKQNQHRQPTQQNYNGPVRVNMPNNR